MARKITLDLDSYEIDRLTTIMATHGCSMTEAVHLVLKGEARREYYRDYMRHYMREYRKRNQRKQKAKRDG